MKRLFAFTIILGIVMSLIAAPASAAEPVNLAREGTATSSGATSGNGPENAVDGDKDTRWYSKKTATSKFLQVELAKNANITQIVIHENSVTTPDYFDNMEYSLDGAAWTPAEIVSYTTKDATLGGKPGRERVYELAPFIAKFVRVTTPETSTASSIGIYEFEVLGEYAAEIAVPTGLAFEGDVLKWDAVGGAEKYIITVKNSAGETAHTLETAENSYDFSGVLAIADTYSFTVKAVSANAVSADSEAISKEFGGGYVNLAQTANGGAIAANAPVYSSSPAANAIDGDRETAMMFKSGNSEFNMSVELAEVSEIDKIVTYAGNTTSPAPFHNLLYSADGKKWYKVDHKDSSGVEDSDSSTSYTYVYTYELKTPVVAKYLKYDFGSNVRVYEFEAYGKILPASSALADMCEFLNGDWDSSEPIASGRSYDAYDFSTVNLTNGSEISVAALTGATVDGDVLRINKKTEDAAQWSHAAVTVSNGGDVLTTQVARECRMVDESVPASLECADVAIKDGEVTVTMVNDDVEESGAVSVIVAFYDAEGTALASVSVSSEKDFAPFAAQDVRTLTLPAPAEAGSYTVKAFVLDSVQSLMPLRKNAAAVITVE